MSRAKTFLNHKEQTWLVEVIQQAELFTTGEIRVHLEDSYDQPIFDRAAEVFAALNMHETKFRNGVLIYVAVGQHEHVIIGDNDIHKIVGDEFWEQLTQELTVYFNKGLHFEGLAKTIKKIGIELKQHFPIEDMDNPNELSDEISFG